MRASGTPTGGHRRIVDFLADDQDDADEEIGCCGGGGGGGAAMLPVFVPGDDDTIEVTLEIDESSAAVRGGAASEPSLSRSSSVGSRIRRKFGWLSPKPSAEPANFSSDRESRRMRARLDRTRSGAQRALTGLRFISRATGSVELAELWRPVEQRFDSLSTDGLLSREDFGECIGMTDSKEFAGGIFDALSRRKRQSLERINKEELHDFWLQISDQSFDARLQIFFDMADTNEDGRITREEVKELIVLSASANKLSKLKEQAEEYAALIMEELDPENLGYIELWQLEALLLQRDTYMNYSRPVSTAASSWSQNTNGGAAAGSTRLPRPRCCRGLRRRQAMARLWVEENWRRVWVAALWASAVAALFAWKFLQYRRRTAFAVMGYCLPTAKGAAETLKLNMALVLLPVCRNTLTRLRATRARLFVPFDDNINFHKTIAGAIVVATVVHAGTHLLCDFPRVVRSPPELYALVAPYFGAERPSYLSLAAGAEGATGILMVALMSVSFTLATRRFRRSGVRLPSPLDRLAGFNAFWYSHHLLALVYVLLLVHGYFMFLVHQWYERTTWMYISVPLLLYIGERTLRAFRSKAYSVKIHKVSLLPGSVLTLVMSKPHGFRYRSGQYIFLQCPTISPFEWHPFSITSAPSDEYLSVHIRTAGDWTQELKRIFTEHYLLTAKPTLRELISTSNRSLPRLLVDGPYGAPAQDFRNYDVLLLVGLGIGATPFISILRDLLNNSRLLDELMELATEGSRSEYSSSSFSFSTPSSSSSSKKRPHRTTSAHFYWVTREPGSFEWFKGVMNEVAEMDKKGVIEMHNYLTSVYEEGDARTTLLTMVQALNHAKNGYDIVSGTRVRTHFARPNWNEVFTKIASKHKGKTVGVFYCGTPVLAKELRRLSHEMSHKTSTRFHFHKEYF